MYILEIFKRRVLIAIDHPDQPNKAVVIIRKNGQERPEKHASIFIPPVRSGLQREADKAFMDKVTQEIRDKLLKGPAR
jgi:hypothetical protein